MRTTRSDEESAPTEIDADVLVGTMPTAALLDDILCRLTWKHEWKPVRMALTAEAIYLARQGEDTLRDRIPLLEIVKVKKSDCVQSETLARQARDINSLDQDMHILQIHTLQDGFNCGKLYQFNASSEQQRDNWLAHVESAIALAIGRAAPYPLEQYQCRLRAIYRHPWFQSIFAVTLLIFR